MSTFILLLNAEKINIWIFIGEKKALLVNMLFSLVNDANLIS